MRFFRRADGQPLRLAVFPGSFNPVTVAHVELVCAALPLVDEVVLVLPREFPHKKYEGASFPQRVAMLNVAFEAYPRVSIASTERGLFIEISQECRESYGEDVRLTFLCGRDAAERIAGWDYGRPGIFAEMLGQFDLLVAARNGEYQVPPDFRNAIRTLAISGHFDDVSASDVRGRLTRGESWEHLVPRELRARIPEIYSVTAPPTPCRDSIRET